MSMRRLAILLIVAGALPAWLEAQQPCPNFRVVIGSPEDELMLAVNGADNAQAQLSALEKFVQEHPDSTFLACANEYAAAANLKLGNYDKAIEYAEKDLAANYRDLNLLLTLARAYAASGKASDTFFAAINQIPAEVKAETASSRPSKFSDADWEKKQAENQQVAADSRTYAVWAFFQVIPRVSDPAKRLQALDAFLQAYPDVEKEDAPQVYSAYFQAYQGAGNLDKALEYGEKAIAANPNDVVTLNTLGLIYAFYSPHPSPEKAGGYAQRALTAAQALKKPEGVDEGAFTKDQNTQLGIAHMTLGDAALARPEKAGRAAAIEEFKTATTLLEGRPELECQALYYLAFAYERGTPANHAGAIAALTKAQDLPGPFQGEARALLAKVRAAVAARR